MANVRNGNTYYIDIASSADSDCLISKNVKVTAIFMTATSAGGILVLKDTSGAIKGEWRVATSGDCKEFLVGDYSLTFPNGIKAGTVTNCVATLLIEESKG